MFRTAAQFAVLFSFLFGQTISIESVNPTAFVPLKKSAKVMITENQVPAENSKNSVPPAADDEEESDTSQHSDSHKFLISHLKFRFIPSLMKNAWVDSQFTQWRLTSDFDRPPKLLA